MLERKDEIYLVNYLTVIERQPEGMDYWHYM